MRSKADIPNDDIHSIVATAALELIIARAAIKGIITRTAIEKFVADFAQ